MELEPDRLLEAEIPPPVTVVAADDSAAEDLRRRAALWDQATGERDEVAAAELLAPEFALELVQPVRNIMTREVWLEVLADYVIHEWDVEERIVDVDGDCAAMLQRVRMQATVMGEDRSGTFVMSDLWRRIDGEWRLSRRHSTPLSTGSKILTFPVTLSMDIRSSRSPIAFSPDGKNLAIPEENKDRVSGSVVIRG